MGNLSKNHKHKISEGLKHAYKNGYVNALKGKPQSEETKLKRGKAISRALTGKKLTLEHRRNLSLSHKGLHNSPLTQFKKGEPKSIEWRKAMANRQRGKSSHLWKGGITETNKKLRSGLEYRLWREAVFQRDNWTCVWCFERGVYLEADHIKPFCDYPELRLSIDNGRTLCKSCHSKTDTYKGRSKKNKKYA